VIGRATRVPVVRAGTTLSLALASACTLAAGSSDPASAPAPLPPPGHGTLSQRDVSLTLRSGALQLLVTPLAAEVLVVTAPDTYRRLEALAAPHRAAAAEDALFLVSFFSDQPDVPFVAEEVQFISGGLRSRPARIVPVTAGWGAGRVAQRATESAVYVFDRPVDLEGDVLLLYGIEQSQEWSAIHPRIQAERARARARAGITPPDRIDQSSRSYFEILR